VTNLRQIWDKSAATADGRRVKAFSRVGIAPSESAQNAHRNADLARYTYGCTLTLLRASNVV